MTKYFVKVCKDTQTGEWRLWNPFDNSIFRTQEEGLASMKLSLANCKTFSKWTDVRLVEVDV